MSYPFNGHDQITIVNFILQLYPIYQHNINQKQQRSCLPWLSDIFTNIDVISSSIISYSTSSLSGWRVCCSQSFKMNWAEVTVLQRVNSRRLGWFWGTYRYWSTSHAMSQPFSTALDRTVILGFVSPGMASSRRIWRSLGASRDVVIPAITSEMMPPIVDPAVLPTTCKRTLDEESDNVSSDRWRDSLK